MAREVLSRVRVPVLLIVGGVDVETLRLNQEARRMLPRRSRLTVVPGAGHSFEEPGAMGAVGEHAAAWLERHVALRRPGRFSSARQRLGNLLANDFARHDSLADALTILE